MPLSAVIQGIIIVNIKIDLRKYHPKINFGEVSIISQYLRKKIFYIISKL